MQSLHFNKKTPILLINRVWGKVESPFNPVHFSPGGILAEGPEVNISARVVRFLLFNDPCFKQKLDADTNILSKKSVDDTINSSTHILMKFSKHTRLVRI